MNTHANARTTLHARLTIVRRVLEEHRPVARVAEDFALSRRTVYKWLHRYRQQGQAGLVQRSSRPAQVHRRLDEAQQAEALALRRERLHGRTIARHLGVPFSTLARYLKQAGLGRLSQLEPAMPVRRYEKQKPGELLHVDTKQFMRFEQPGQRVTGNRQGGQSRGVGYEVAHVALDDATRLSDVELLPDEKATTTTGFMVRALAWFSSQGITVDAVLSDNAPAYKSKQFCNALQALEVRHKRTRPYSPQTNGKAERFIQTLKREWAYGMSYVNSEERQEVLPYWLKVYNDKRCHLGIKGKTPRQRLRKLSV
jgi:transposase InsO family protein